MSNSSKGCDLSHFNDQVDFHEIRRSCDFVALKATDGTGFIDPTFHDRQARARTVGFKRTLFYHFYRPSQSSIAQAEHFAEVIGKLHPNERIVLDVEACDGWDSKPANEHVISILAWYAHVEQVLGLTDDYALIYLSHGWAVGQFGDQLPRLKHIPLWVARYANAPGSVSPWADWKIWQNSERGTITGAGAAGTVDTDMWNGQLS